jgi:hypothetical protein
MGGLGASATRQDVVGGKKEIQMRKFVFLPCRKNERVPQKYLNFSIKLRPFVLRLCFNTPRHFTSLRNLRHIIFGLTLFGQFISIYVSGNIILNLRPLQKHG